MMVYLRTLAERVLRDVSRHRKLPREFKSVPIIVSSAGGLGVLLKPMIRVDPVLFATVARLVKPGNTVWDVGANVGLFTFASAALAGAKGRVVAFEPDVALIGLLRKSVFLQGSAIAPVTIVPAGIAASTGLRTFAISQRSRASNALFEYGNSQMGGYRELQTIPCFDLDSCLSWLQVPDVIKVDVEGAEMEVLEGAGKILDDIRPTIMCEVNETNTSSVSAVFDNAGYQMFDAERPLVKQNRKSVAAWNTIALPEEKAAGIIQQQSASG